MTLGKCLDRSAQIDRRLFHDLLNARVGGVRREKDFAALELPVDGVLFVDCLDGEDFPALAIDQRDIVAGCDAFGAVFVARKR